MSHHSHDVSGVNSQDLMVLNGWPEYALGFQEENQLIELLNELCKKHGYGRIAQLAEQIEDIWRNPEKLKEYAQARQKRIQELEADLHWLGLQEDDPE